MCRLRLAKTDVLNSSGTAIGAIATLQGGHSRQVTTTARSRWDEHASGGRADWVVWADAQGIFGFLLTRSAAYFNAVPRMRIAAWWLSQDPPTLGCRYPKC